MIIDKIKYIPRAEEDDLDETIDALTTLLQEDSDLDMKRALAELLIDFCDEWDQEDSFGTEGWRHRLGLD